VKIELEMFRARILLALVAIFAIVHGFKPTAFVSTKYGVSTASLRLSKSPFLLNGEKQIQHIYSTKRAPQYTTALQATTTPVAENPVAAAKPAGSLVQTLKVGALFGLWFALNIGYNITNKKVLNMVPKLTYMVAFLQLFIGWFYLLPVWGLGIRKAPVLTAEETKNLMPVVFLHLLTHLGAVVSLSAGAVSFTHIVKAAEPAVSAALSAVALKQFMPLPVYLSLIPVMGGVALASATELSFTWLSFGAAMVSNIASAYRGIVGKSALGKPQGKNMNAANVYGVMTILSTLLCLPISYMIEAKHIGPSLKAIAAAGKTKELIIQTLLSGFFYYLYNEVAFLTLDNVAPVTHAIGNTIKRIVIIVTSVLVFGSTMTMQGMLGSAIAIGGVFLYSLAKQHFK
jgi:solute carrier family 35 protein E1